MAVRWRKTLILLHRDVGFTCLGLTLVYAVSGLAVNHRAHWDYNYSQSVENEELGSPQELLGLPGESGSLAREHQDQLIVALNARLGREHLPNKAFWRGRDKLSLFFGKSDRDVVDYHPSTGRAEWVHSRPRLAIRFFNILHLNERRKVWTWIADSYALSLLFLGASGALIVKGRKGFKGRGGRFALAGIVIPLLLLAIF